jgi:hypothetical protein
MKAKQVTCGIVSYPQVIFITVPLKQVHKRITDNKQQSKTALYRFWAPYYCVSIIVSINQIIQPKTRL